jgi:transcriptional regulator with GAF, ATPase, and Fis domain/Tfp pilus assembly protein PilF
MTTSDRDVSGISVLRARLADAKTQPEQLDLLVKLGDELAGCAPAEAESCFRRAVELARALRCYEQMGHAGKMLAEQFRAAGDLDASVACAEYVIEAARASGSRRLEGSYAYLTGLVSRTRGEYDLARARFEQSLAMWRESGYQLGEQTALAELGSLLGLQGRLEEALESYQECLRVSDELKDDRLRARLQFNIGWALQELGRWEDAAESFYRAIALSEQFDLPALRSHVVNALGELYLDRDKPAKAVSMFEAVVEAGRRGEALPEIVREALGNLGLAHFRSGDLASAERAYEEALPLAEQSADRRELAILSSRVAELALAQGQLERSGSFAKRAIAIAQEAGLKPQESEARRVKAIWFAARGENDAARESFEQALALLQDVEDSYSLARVRLHYGKFLLATGEREPAVRYVKAASRVFRKLSVVAEAEEANRLLFQHEVRADTDMALLQGISGLATFGLEPAAFLDRAVGLLCEAMHFDCGAVLAQGRPVLLNGRPDLVRAQAQSLNPQVVSTPDSLSWPVPDGGKILGCVYLERNGPSTTEHNNLVLQAIANLLATPIRRLLDVPVRAVEERPEVAGLRYRGVVGRNPQVLKVLMVVNRVAGTNVPVLIRGESGTGKELVARALHDSGSRAGKPFVAVNGAAVPDNLLEAEFFGVEKGAATGVAARKGKFELARSGTVFLDEIGDMSPALQAKLLRVLQEKSFERVGGAQSVEVDVRIVAATNQDVNARLQSGQFRNDLYYRLNAVELVLPPLRERKEDIPELVRHFVTRSNQEYGRGISGASEALIGRFGAYDWPGNIRELQHVVERAVILASGDMLGTQDLPPEFHQPSDADVRTDLPLRTVRRALKLRAAADAERSMLLACLGDAGWNVNKAAQAAGYSRAQFYRLMHQHAIERPD